MQYKIVPLVALLCGALGLSCSGSSGTNEPLNPYPDRDVFAVAIDKTDWRFGGPAGNGGAGDFLMQNRQVRFVVQAGGTPKSWVPFASALIDADVVRDGQTTGDDLAKDFLLELSPLADMLRAIKPVSGQIISDGSDGEARVRVTGVGVGIPIIDCAIAVGKNPLSVTVDYVLAAGSPALKIITTVTNGDSFGTVNPGDGLYYLKRGKLFVPGMGMTETTAGSGDIPYLLMSTDDLAYGLAPQTGTFAVPIDQANMYPVFPEGEKIDVGQSVTYTRYFVAARTGDAVLSALATLRGEAVGQVTVTVNRADQADSPADYYLMALDEDGLPLLRVHADAGHQAVMTLPAGVYRFKAGDELRGYGDVSDLITVTAATPATATANLPATGRVHAVISGDSPLGALTYLPAKVSVFQGKDVEHGAALYQRVYTLGQQTFILPPGSYTFIATRGYEYDSCTASASVDAGQTVDFTCTLHKVVDSDGWLAGDMHLHSELSIDAKTVAEQRVVQMLAEGIEFTPNTEHDFISSMQYLAEATALPDPTAAYADRLLHFVQGIEVSAPNAHYNAYPAVNPPGTPLYYGIEWFDAYETGNTPIKPQPEQCRLMREKFSAGIVQINHPSMDQGLFYDQEYDPAVGLAPYDKAAFDPSLADAVEIINSGSVGNALDKVLPAWYSLLNQGVYLTGVASSDSHTDDNPSHSRVLVYVGHDSVEGVSEDQWVAAIKDMKVAVSAGPFTDIRVGTAMPGDVADGSGGTVTVKATVQAPAWMPVTMAYLVANGEVVHTFEAADLAEADGVRLSKDVELTLAKDTWVVLVAGAPEADLWPEKPGARVLGVTNPLFVDVDGGGFTPPGL